MLQQPLRGQVRCDEQVVFQEISIGVEVGSGSGLLDLRVPRAFKHYMLDSLLETTALLREALLCRPKGSVTKFLIWYQAQTGVNIGIRLSIAIPPATACNNKRSHPVPTQTDGISPNPCFLYDKPYIPASLARPHHNRQIHSALPSLPAHQHAHTHAYRPNSQPPSLSTLHTTFHTNAPTKAAQSAHVGKLLCPPNQQRRRNLPFCASTHAPQRPGVPKLRDRRLQCRVCHPTHAAFGRL